MYLVVKKPEIGQKYVKFKAIKNSPSRYLGTSIK